MINPIFPDFKLITASDSGVINDFTKNFLPYSDFNTVSMLSWNSDNINAFSFLNDNLVIKLKGYLSDDFLYSVLGSSNIQDTVETLLATFNKLNLVPEVVVKDLDSKIYEIIESRDDFDYVLDTRETIMMEGGDYKNMRKNVSSFLKHYPTNFVRVLDLSQKDIRNSIIELTKTWCDHKGFSNSEVDSNVKGIESYVEFVEREKKLALGLFVGYELVAFSLNEVLPNNWAMGHFGKADNSYKHAALYLEHATSIELQKRGIQYLNVQQDTGLEGLREAKMVLHPSKFLKKYTVSKL